jgi:hypothetical protein
VSWLFNIGDVVKVVKPDYPCDKFAKHIGEIGTIVEAFETEYDGCEWRVQLDHDDVWLLMGCNDIDPVRGEPRRAVKTVYKVSKTKATPPQKG